MFSGICGSDIHTLASGWAYMSSKWPQVVGHEIVGKVIKVGDEVKGLQIGDMVGIGAQCDSCMKCESCNESESRRIFVLPNVISGYARSGRSLQKKD